MSADLEPAWPLPVMACAQVLFGSIFVTGMRESGDQWDLEYATLGVPFVVAGLVILGLAARNCLRLWRVEVWEASWGLVSATAAAAIFSMMTAIGPMTIGEWRWRTLPHGVFSAFLIVILVREVRRRLARGADPCRVEHAEMR